MYKNKKIAVIVPAFNEERFIAGVIDSMPSFVDRVYVVNDASTDQTLEIMTHKAKLNPRVIVINRDFQGGVGSAILSGHIKALKDEMDILVVMAGDGQMDPDLLPNFLDPVAEGRADYCKGDRISHAGNRQGMPRGRAFGNLLLTKLTQIASGYWQIADPQNGYTAISAAVFKRLDISKIEPGFAFENDMLMKLNVIGARVVDIRHPARYEGQNSKINYLDFTFKTSWVLMRGFAWRIWKKYVATNPDSYPSAQANTKVLFLMNTAADVYTWTYSIQTLLNKGHEVKILARDYGHTLDILRQCGFPFVSFKPIASKYLRILEIFRHIQKGFEVSRDFNPTILVGFGVDVALLSVLINKPGLVFTDCEPMHLQNWLNNLWASAVITPLSFLNNIGKKQLRLNSYKELAYLSPDRFSPDPSIYRELGLERDEKYVILRFNIFDAVHDIGRKGFSEEDKINLCRELHKYVTIFISPVGALPPELEVFRLKIQPYRIHHVLYYAQMVISDTGTMTTEAAVLGTPGIICLSNVAEFGTFMELERKYGLLYAFSDSAKVIQKSIELLKQPNLKWDWAQKRQKLLAEKADFTRFITDLIEQYPGSLIKYREAASIEGIS